MDSVCKLIKETKNGRDRYGNPIVERTEREVFCQAYSVNRSEFYSAANAGLNPQLVIRLSDYLEYDGEKLVEFEGERYSVIRTYRDRGSMHQQTLGISAMDTNAIELTLQPKVGNIGTIGSE